MPPSRPQKYKQDEELNRLRRFLCGNWAADVEPGSRGGECGDPGGVTAAEGAIATTAEASGAGSTAEAANNSTYSA